MRRSDWRYPASNSVFDMHYAIRTERHYFAARDDGMLEIVTNDGQRTTRAMTLTNVHFYPEFVRDTLRRVRAGLPPIADLTDNAEAVSLIGTAYALSPLGQAWRKRTPCALSMAAWPRIMLSRREARHGRRGEPLAWFRDNDPGWTLRVRSIPRGRR